MLVLVFMFMLVSISMPVPVVGGRGFSAPLPVVRFRESNLRTLVGTETHDGTRVRHARRTIDAS